MKVFNFSNSRTLGRVDSYLADGYTLVGISFHSVRSFSDVPPEGNISFSSTADGESVVEISSINTSFPFSRTFCVFRLVKPSDLPF